MIGKMQALSKFRLRQQKAIAHRCKDTNAVREGWKDVGAMGNLKDPPGQFMSLKAGVNLTKS
jgi:hypothetical protein